jgi:hypothetical protein
MHAQDLNKTRRKGASHDRPLSQRRELLCGYSLEKILVHISFFLPIKSEMLIIGGKPNTEKELARAA